MTKERRQHSPEFKTKVVLEVLRETGTVAEIASKYGVHPNQIAKWKKSFLEKAPEIFSSKKSDREKSGQQLESELYKKIGQLQIEIDWLKKKTGF